MYSRIILSYVEHSLTPIYCAKWICFVATLLVFLGTVATHELMLLPTL